MINGREIIQFGMIRSGSTLIYNILKELEPVNYIVKTHNYPSIRQRIQRIPLVCTFRDPLDIICSSIKRNEEKPNRDVIIKHISILQKRGFDDFIKLEKRYKNKINLKYENFYNNSNYIFDQFEIFFDIQIKNDFRNEIANKLSIKTVNNKISKFKSFSELDESSQFHGLHISNTNGLPKSYMDFFNNDDIEYLKLRYKDFRKKYNYV